MSGTWLVGATVVDGLGGEPVVGQAVLVQDGLVAGLGGEPPVGAEVLDCAGLVLTPGLIDAHVHLGLSSNMTDNMRRVLPVAEIAADMFANCAETLAGGFTTVRDVGGADGGLVGVVASGKVPGPRILTSGPILCQTGGHGYLGAEWEPSEHWDHHAIPGLRTLSLMSDGPDAMRRNAREAFRRGASFLKLCVTGGVVSNHDELTDTQLTVDEIRAAVEEAAARGTYVTVHAHNNDGIRNAVEAGALCVEHGSQIDEETAALMARRGVALVPTLSVVEALHADPVAAGLPLSLLPRVAAVRQSMRDAIPVARAAGVRVGSGSDLIGPHQRDRGMELVLRASIETPMDALVAATRVNADILGIADEVGTIEVGKQGDLVAWSADPLADANVFNDRDRVALVLQSGRVVRDAR